MEIKFKDTESLMTLARYLIDQDNRIKELEQETYELSRERYRLDQEIERFKDADFPVVKEVTE